MKNNRNLQIALTLNLIVVIMEMIGLIMTLPNQGFRFFQFYTQDSNLIALFACGVMAANHLRCLSGKQEKIGKFAMRLKYLSVCMLALTFFVVISVLAPMTGAGGYKRMLFDGVMLYHHFLCPILVFCSFIFFEKEGELRKKDVTFALIPTIIYAMIALLLNVFHLMDGPYPFLRVYDQPIYMSFVWFVVILGGAYLIAWLVWLIRNRILKGK